MEQNTIISEIEAIFREVLKRDDIHLLPETVASDVRGWDSLTNMVLINTIEKHYGIRFSFREIVRFRNVGDLCSAIESKRK